VTGWPRRRRRTPQPPARVPGPPAPAPGRYPGRHHTGGTEYVIRAYKCGCILLWDGDGRLTGTTPCTASDLDDELKDILRDR
jgi:hypothetical protein